MSSDLARVLIPLSLYAVLVLVVGVVASRRAGRSPEEYFLAGRTFGTLVLFMALFGTNATAFVFVGIPGRAYHDGIGVFSINAPIVALCTPLTFWLVGAPARRMARRLGALSPAELYARRFDSALLGFVLFAVFTVYTIPYMVSAVVGASVTLESVTSGAIPAWLGGLGVVSVSLAYTTLGGMRATAWTNVLQGTLFLGFLLVAFGVVVANLGGPGEAMRSVADADPSLLIVEREGLYAPRPWLSWGLLISLTVIAFPHMLVRLLAARGDEAVKGVCRLYPLALLLLWLPPVLIGVWGAVEFPGLEGRESDRIFQMMIDLHLPPVVGAAGFVAVLAAVMSSLDAMILTLSTMLVRDVLDRARPARDGSTDVLSGRLFAVVIAGAVYALSLFWNRSVFEIAAVAFAGYVTLTPTLFLGVRWRRFTSPGALASILAGSAALYLTHFDIVPGLGFLPVFWGFVAAALAAIGVSLATPPSPRALAKRAFGR